MTDLLLIASQIEKIDDKYVSTITDSDATNLLLKAAQLKTSLLKLYPVTDPPKITNPPPIVGSGNTSSPKLSTVTDPPDKRNPHTSAEQVETSSTKCSTVTDPPVETSSTKLSIVTDPPDIINPPPTVGSGNTSSPETDLLDKTNSPTIETGHKDDDAFDKDVRQDMVDQMLETPNQDEYKNLKEQVDNNKSEESLPMEKRKDVSEMHSDNTTCSDDSSSSGDSVSKSSAYLPPNDKDDIYNHKSPRRKLSIKSPRIDVTGPDSNDPTIANIKKGLNDISFFVSSPREEVLRLEKINAAIKKFQNSIRFTTESNFDNEDFKTGRDKIFDSIDKKITLKHP